MNPVNAEIDYTYTQTGTLRDPSGAIATPAGSNVTQHITIPFTVSKDLTAPSVGAFSGGDPTQGRYAEALSAGTALVYWAGVYYSTAHNTCVDVDFTPPSYTVRLVPGAMMRVNAEIKTKAGASVKGVFSGARTRSGIGTVSPAVGQSPMAFTFTAPSQPRRALSSMPPLERALRRESGLRVSAPTGAAESASRTGSLVIRAGTSF